MFSDWGFSWGGWLDNRRGEWWLLAQLLTQLRQAEIQGRKGEAGVHEIGLQPLQGFP